MAAASAETSTPATVLDPSAPCLPDTSVMYLLKDALKTFCLRESDLDGVDYISTRNFSGPYPIKQFRGADLLAAAEKKFGGSEGFLAKLKRQALKWKCPLITAPSYRYFIVRGARESLRTSQYSGTWAITKKLQNRFFHAFQDCDCVCLIFMPINTRALTSYGIMLTPPGAEATVDPKSWATTGVMSTFKVEWRPAVYIRTEQLPDIFDDQDAILDEDGTELPTALGEAICDLIDADVIDEEKRKGTFRADSPPARRSPVRRASPPPRRHTRSRSPPVRRRSRSPPPRRRSRSRSPPRRRSRSRSPPRRR